MCAWTSAKIGAVVKFVRGKEVELAEKWGEVENSTIRRGLVLDDGVSWSVLRGSELRARDLLTLSLTFQPSTPSPMATISPAVS